MPEEPKRLAPSLDTVRQIYLLSGNECAFPGCAHRIINSEGVLIGELCHIEGAMPGSSRFNPDQTNEERRAPSNLLLMCHAHHRETDDEEMFPVARLQEIKANHENTFRGAIDRIREAVTDLTERDSVQQASSLNRLNDVLQWGHGPEELEECLRELAPFAENLRRLPVEARQLLMVMAARRSGRVMGASGERVSLKEIELVTGKTPQYLLPLIELLERFRFISGVWEDDPGLPYVDLLDFESGWPIWADLSEFAEATGIPLSEIIVSLRFDYLD